MMIKNRIILLTGILTSVSVLFSTTPQAKRKLKREKRMHFLPHCLFASLPSFLNHPSLARTFGASLGAPPILVCAFGTSSAGGEVYSNEKRRVKREKRRYINVFHFSLLSFLFSLIKNFPYCLNEAPKALSEG